MSHVVLIGYGNPLRRDDGFGWQLARRLQQELNDPDVEIIAAHQLTPELAEPLSRADYAIFADASTAAEDGEPELRELASQETREGQFTHHVSPQCLLSFTRTLYGAAPGKAWLLSVRARDMGFGPELSPAVARALETAVTGAGAYCRELARQSRERADRREGLLNPFECNVPLTPGE